MATICSKAVDLPSEYSTASDDMISGTCSSLASGTSPEVVAPSSARCSSVGSAVTEDSNR